MVLPATKISVQYNSMETVFFQQYAEQRHHRCCLSFENERILIGFYQRSLGAPVTWRWYKNMFSFIYYVIQILSRGHSLICISVNKMKCHKKDLILVERWVLDMLCCCSQSVLDNRNIPQTNLFASQVFTRDPALLRESRPKNDYSNLNPNSSAVGWREVKGCV